MPAETFLVKLQGMYVVRQHSVQCTEFIVNMDAPLLLQFGVEKIRKFSRPRVSEMGVADWDFSCQITRGVHCAAAIAFLSCMSIL